MNIDDRTPKQLYEDFKNASAEPEEPNITLADCESEPSAVTGTDNIFDIIFGARARERGRRAFQQETSGEMLWNERVPHDTLTRTAAKLALTEREVAQQSKHAAAWYVQIYDRCPYCDTVWSPRYKDEKCPECGCGTQE